MERLLDASEALTSNVREIIPDLLRVCRYLCFLVVNTIKNKMK